MGEVGLTLVIPGQFELQLELWKFVEKIEIDLEQVELSKI